MTHYLIHTRLLSLTEHFTKEHVSGTGTDAIFNTVPIGWFAVFEGSHEAIYIGTEKPELAEGDEVDIIIRKKEPHHETN